MTRTPTKRHPDGTTAVDQGSVGDYDISFNPDDDRWYVHPHGSSDTVAHYAERRNAIQYARLHTPPR